MIRCTLHLLLITYVHVLVLQISEMYSSGGELHIELLTGQPQGSKALWVSGRTVWFIHLCCIYMLHATHVQ